MPQCFDCMYQQGHYGNGVIEVRHMNVPDPAVDVCPGDFLTSQALMTSEKEAVLISSVAWDTNLATTQENAKLVFEGVSAGEYEANACIEQEPTMPYWKYRQGTGFARSYEIVDAAGAADPSTWLEGQGFTFGKNSSSNALVNNKIQMTSNSDLIVFRAITSSGPTAMARATVEFAE
jgi:hypothetical protein